MQTQKIQEKMEQYKILEKQIKEAKREQAYHTEEERKVTKYYEFKLRELYGEINKLKLEMV